MTGEQVTDPQLAAVLATLTGVLPATIPAFAAGTAPATLPSVYVEVFVSRRFGGVPRLCSATATRSWRAGLRSVALLEANAYRARELAEAAFEGKRLQVEDRTSTPVAFETAEDIGPDDGRFSGLTTYTFTL